LLTPTDGDSNPASLSVGAAWAWEIATSSMKAVLSPPALFNPWNATVCVPAATVKATVV
jgi:hypothetical protein